MKPTVHVVGDDKQVSQMFTNNGWVVVDSIEDADLVQFCGFKPDVHPNLYDEAPIKGVEVDLDREVYERGMFDLARGYTVPIAGIGRGAHLVHVLNGGRLWQYVNGHDLATGHFSYFAEGIEHPNNVFKNRVFTNSYHKQMMRPGVGKTLMYAMEGFSKVKQDQNGTSVYADDYKEDLEALFYKDTLSLSFQPHPEKETVAHPCQTMYFHLLKEFLL